MIIGPPWDGILLACAAGLATLVAVLFTGMKRIILKWFIRWERQIDKANVANGLAKLARFHQCVETLRNLEFVDRVLMFQGQNCGGLPTPTKPYTIRCFHGWATDPKSNPDRLYDFNIRLDSHYINLLIDLLKNGTHIETTATMPADSMLKPYYMTEGVVQSYLAVLEVTHTHVIYISIASYTRAFTEAELTKLRLITNRLEAISKDEALEHHSLENIT
jgi:hypothetical protein